MRSRRRNRRPPVGEGGTIPDPAVSAPTPATAAPEAATGGVLRARPPPHRRLGWRLSAAVLVVLGAVAVALIVYVDATLPPPRQEIDAADLGHPVTLYRDRHWVPHIFAETTEDAAFALGFAHAEDRLWQMESMRRLAAGRLAELIGPAGLDSDRRMRTLGFARLVAAQEATLSAEARRVLTAYAAGVNSRLDAGETALPPEFVVLRRRPEPWTVGDSLLWLRLMAFRLAQNRGAELLRARLAGRLTPEQIDDVLPGNGSPEPLREAAASAPDGPAPAADRPPLGASNAWAVGGGATADGWPLLASDPHLPLGLPAPWYLARIVLPDREIAGATAPGYPWFLFGHNGRIAWGLTGAEADIEDLFVERLSADGERVATADGEVPLDRRRETIVVRGAADEVIEVRSTPHGPLLDHADAAGAIDRLPAVDGDTDEPGVRSAVALAATYLRSDDRTVEAILRLNAASGWSDLLAARDLLDSPPLNVVYADVEGNIGLTLGGRLPIRRDHQGSWPKAGWTGQGDWIGFVAPADLPRSLNPPAGRVVNANNRPVPAGFPWYVGDAFAAEGRAGRIEALLAADPPATLDRMTALQLDAVSPLARLLLPAMLAGLPADLADDPLVARLRDWPGTMDRRRPEPTLFAAWLREFDRAVFADEMGDVFPAFQSVRPELTARILADGGVWCDDVTTEVAETCHDRLATAWRAAVRDLERRLGTSVDAWLWGAVHQARFRHPLFERFPLLGRLAAVVVATDGGWDTINRGAYSVWDDRDPFAHVHGPGLRTAYDLGDLSRSRFVIAPGQSGNPFSRHYGDVGRLWADGGWIRLSGDRTALDRDATARVTFSPRPSPPAGQSAVPSR